MRFAFFTSVSLVALHAQATRLNKTDPISEHADNMDQLAQLWTDWIDQQSSFA